MKIYTTPPKVRAIEQTSVYIINGIIYMNGANKR